MERQMKIIRDEEMGGIMMIPLFQQWGVNRCNIKDCTEKHTTICVWEGEVKTNFASQRDEATHKAVEKLFKFSPTNVQ